MQFNPNARHSRNESTVLSRRYSSTSDIDSFTKTKTSIYSMWNSVKYEVQSKFGTKFSFDSPICLLGLFYHFKMTDSANWSDKKTSCAVAFEKFKQDFYSRIWFTYRKEYEPILDTTYTTDIGWGCMIRTGQMLLAQALLTHFLSRSWRWKGSLSDKEDMIHRMIIKWFADIPNATISPFSIHELVRIGQKHGKNPGDWYGPASLALMIKSALKQAAKSNNILQDIRCYVSQDCTLYLQDMIDLCTQQNKQQQQKAKDPLANNWNSIIILIPVRLGGQRFNTEYSMYLKEILSLPYTIGVIGGKPRHSLYFVGFQEDKLLHIDPHYCQRTIDVSQTDFTLETFHCTSPRKVSFESIDPSCTIGFYLKTKDEFEDFIKFTKHQIDFASKLGNYPIYSLIDGSDNSIGDCGGEEHTDRILQMRYRVVDPQGNIQRVIKAEEFVLL